mmetsp:Transcript_49968/g.100623  ORF Transcript_49968/g.100623 Transcript_49968/m.100623 type:complete len:172 (+) Transcript_49968:63-578(+)
MAMATKSNDLAVDFGNINEANLDQLRKLNISIFPVRYNDKFYQNVLVTPVEVTQYAYWNGFVVGAICCRLEPATGPGPKKLYIMTIGVLAAYRRRNIARKLLERMLEKVQGASPGPLGDVSEVYLHVQTNNDDALAFYKTAGFTVGDILKGYYKRIEPPDCYVVSKSISRS